MALSTPAFETGSAVRAALATSRVNFKLHLSGRRAAASHSRQLQPVVRKQHLICSANAEGGVAAAASSKPPTTVPKGPRETVEQAVAAAERAFAAGVRRQRVELLLPLIGATDIDDWPGGIRQMFKAITPMVEQMLLALRQLPGLEGGLAGKILDDGDAVGAWEGKNLAAIVFPTAETLSEVRAIAEQRSNGLTILVNPQWSVGGQVISDFGIFPWQKKLAEDLIASFAEVYSLRQLRINGDEVRMLHAYPAPWQVFVARGLGGEFECVLQQEAPPTYQQLDSLLRSLPWTQSSKPLLERANSEIEFLKRSLDTPPQQQQQEGQQR